MTTKTKPSSTVISNCTFSHDISADTLLTVNKLAEAIAQNAKAIQEVAKILQGPDALLKIS